MARTPIADMSAWPSLALEGNLIAPAMVARIDRRQASEQAEDDYGVRKGLTIRDEISLAFRVGQAHFDAFAKGGTPSVEATRRFARDFLEQTFGFDDFGDASGTVACIAGGRMPVVVVPPSESLDRRSPTLSTDRSRSPTIALQDYLNEREEALWGLVTNGTHVRLLRDNASLTRPAHIEADLAQIFSNEDAASFAALWLLIQRSRFGAEGTPATECALERWRDTGAREGVAARDRLAGQVEIALRVLGSGFLEANPGLAERVRSGALPLTTWFNELLRFVYRLIFLMVAEDRDLLHPASAKANARKLYSEGYSLVALREQSARRTAWDRHHDRYESMKVVFRGLAAGQDALALPALGGLFSADQLPHLETARLRNRAFMEAVYRLSWLSDRSGIVPVNWRAMETEELGSVYESLLELQPQLADDGRALVFASDVSEQKGNQRKTTGSYYTPDSLVQALLDTALDPVLDRAEAEADDPAEALLGLTVIDPACGSGHFLLAAARRIATRLARIRAEGTPTMADFRHALRDVARSCIHGVDRNPMAVELTKVALWIETVDPGLPLGFLDAQIRCGDALLGVFDLTVLERGIPDAAYKPLTGDDKIVARHYARKNKDEKSEHARIEEGLRFGRQHDLLRDFAAMRAMPEDTLDQIAAKSKRLNALTRQGTVRYVLSRACDLYAAAFLAPKIVLPTTAGPDGLPRRGVETIPTSGTVWELLRGVEPHGLLVQNAARALDGARAFHWPLEFPDIMARGGFDVVLGNPPWERIKLQEQEFFATRSPEIASAPNKAARGRLIAALEAAEEDSPERVLYADFITAKRRSEAISKFVRVSGEDGGRFALTGRGDVNTYALFSELFSDVARERAGVIVQTGIATDATTAHFFDHIVNRQGLVSLFDFENRAKVFPGIDSRIKFCLLTLSGVGRPIAEAEFAFFLTDPAQLAELERRFTLSTDDFSLFNPNTRTCPIFRTKRDMEIARKMYQRAGVFWKEGSGSWPEENPWGVKFSTMFHMSNDSGIFRTRDQMENDGWELDGNFFVRGDERYLPLYEAKLFHQYDHRFATFDGVSDRDIRNGNARPMTVDEKSDRETVAIPRYWVPENKVVERLDIGVATTSSLAEPNRTEPNRTEPNRTEPNRTEPNRTEPNRTEPNRTEPNRTEPNRTEPNRTEPNRTEPNRTEPNRTEPNRTEPNRTEPYSTLSQNSPAVRSQRCRPSHRPTDRSLVHDSARRGRPYRYNYSRWLLSFRNVTRATDRRTAIFTLSRGAAAMNEGAPIVRLDYAKALQLFRDITNSTNERTLIADNVPAAAVGNNAPVISYEQSRAVSYALVLGNMNSLPMDWTARISVGGVHMSFFIVKQLPVLPPEAYLEESTYGRPWVQLIVPRVLELTYTSEEMAGFANDLGYNGSPFDWDEDRRHRLRSELDAIFAHMYGLSRADLEWILDAPPPSSSFPALKQHEMRQFGEYRTRRLVLAAWDLMEAGEEFHQSGL